MIKKNHQKLFYFNHCMNNHQKLFYFNRSINNTKNCFILTTLHLNLSSKLNVTVQPVFVSPKLEQQLKRHEIKPPIVNQQCVVYEFKCNLCDAGYVGYTRGHLHERVEGHTRKSSSIYKHYNLQHNSEI